MVNWWRNKNILTFFLGQLKNITKLKPWRLYNVLADKYEWDPQTAKVELNLLLRSQFEFILVF